ncbi:MAG TPA: DUF4010 domain-containing protein [bacterium]|nr:DUF4010 domain-containing protein [bacterium]
MELLSPEVGKLVIALVIGAVIGLERDSSNLAQQARDDQKNNKPRSIAGVRTFALIAVLGAITGLMMEGFLALGILVTIAVFGMIIIFYLLQSLHSHDLGMTTELAMLYAFIFGFLVSAEILPVQLLLALSIVIIFILSRKEEIHRLTLGMKREEINAFTSYALIALVILPFLPNRGFALADISGLESLLANYGINTGTFFHTELINPFKLWLIVSLITGIDVASYVLGKKIGPDRGQIISSLVGGLVSSTAATQALAQESKKTRSTEPLILGAILANFMSFFPIFLLIGSINGAYLVRITPTLLTLLGSFLLLAFWFGLRTSKHKNKTQGELKPDEIFSLRPAINFALLFLGVRILTQAALVLVGEGGFVLASGLAAVTGINAATINVAELAGSSISMQIAAAAFVLINAVNLTAKSLYSFLQGSREFALKFSISMGIVILLSSASLLII